MLRCVMLTGKDGAQHLLKKGFQHAADLDTSGALQPLAPYKKLSEPAAAQSSAGNCGTEGFGTAGGGLSSGAEEVVQMAKPQVVVPPSQGLDMVADAARPLGSLDSNVSSCSGFSADALVAVITDVPHDGKR